MKSHTKVIVPYSTVRNILVQKDLGEKQAHWVTTLQEYDLEIKPLKIVRGQGLCKLAAGSSDNSESDLHFFDEQFLFEREVFPISNPSDSWYHDIKFFLLHGNAPEHLDSRTKRALRLRSAPYQLIDNILFKREVFPISNPPDSWYHDIKFFLLHGNAPEHLDSCSKRALRLIIFCSRKISKEFSFVV